MTVIGQLFEKEPRLCACGQRLAKPMTFTRRYCADCAKKNERAAKRAYQKRKYHEDPEFRARQIARVKRYQARHKLKKEGRAIPLPKVEDYYIRPETTISALVAALPGHPPCLGCGCSLAGYSECRLRCDDCIKKNDAERRRRYRSSDSYRVHSRNRWHNKARSPEFREKERLRAAKYREQKKLQDR